MKTFLINVLLVMMTITGVHAQTVSQTIYPSADNTIYDENSNFSNGSGDFIFSGNTDKNDIRRALVRFDLEEVPSGAAIDSVHFSLSVSKSIAGSKEVKIHRLTTDWGEGASDAEGQEGKGTEAAAGDATWQYSFFETVNWTTAGGDFDPVPSDSAMAGNTGIIVFAGEKVTSDVLSWRSSPSENYGWIIITDETFIPSAKRFYSREFEDAAKRPQITVYYESLSAADAVADADAMIKGWFDIRSQHIVLDNMGDSRDLEAALYSVGGAKIMETILILNQGPNYITVPELEAGMYLMFLQGDQYRKTLKLFAAH